MILFLIEYINLRSIRSWVFFSFRCVSGGILIKRYNFPVKLLYLVVFWGSFLKN